MNFLSKRVKFYQDVKCDITEILIHLQNSFEEYFPQNDNDKNIQRNTFIALFQM
jgi:hypothetical protein